MRQTIGLTSSCVLWTLLLDFARASLPPTTVAISKPKQKGPKGVEQVREWMSAENEFAKLDKELQKALGANGTANWEAFKGYMSDRIQQHHAQQNCKTTGMSPMEECYGQASLTESEYILHQAIDRFSTMFGDAASIHRYHNLAHLVFERTRQMLTDMSLIQESEFHPAAVAKQNEMIRKYKRATPLPAEPTNYEHGYVNSAAIIVSDAQAAKFIQ